MTLESELPVIKCDGCGVCCFHMGFPAFNLPHDVLTGQSGFVDPGSGPARVADKQRWENLPEDLRQQLINANKEYVPPEKQGLDGPCIWLDQNTRLCKHHEHRPQVCRDFEIGCKQCLDWRQTYRSEIRSV